MDLSIYLKDRVIAVSLIILVLLLPQCGFAENEDLSPEDLQKQYIEKLTEAMELNNYDAAISWCDKIEELKLDKESKLQFMMGKAYYKKERYKEAQPYLKMAHDMYCTRYGRLSNKTLEVSDILTRCNNKLRPKNTVPTLSKDVKRFPTNSLLTKMTKTPKYMVDKLNEAIEGKIEYSEVKSYVDDLLPLVFTNDATYEAVTEFLLVSKDYEAAKGILITKLKDEVERTYKYHPRVLKVLEKLERTFPNLTMENATIKREIKEWKALIKDDYTNISQKTPENKLIELLVNAKLAVQKENTSLALAYCRQLDTIESLKPDDLLKIGNIYRKLGYSTKIIEYYSKYLNAIGSEIPPLPEAEYMNILNSLTSLFELNKDYQKAETICAKRAAYIEAKHGKQHPFALTARREVEQYRKLALAETKEQPQAEEKKDNEPTKENASPQEIKAKFTQLRQYIRSGNNSEANIIAEELEPMVQGDPQNLYMLGLGYYSNKNNEKAMDILAKAVAEYNKQYEYENYKTSQALKKLIDLYADNEQYIEAEHHTHQLLAIYENKWGSDHKNTVKIKDSLQELQGKKADSKIVLDSKEEQNKANTNNRQRTAMHPSNPTTLRGGMYTSPENAAKNFILAGFKDDLEYHMSLCLPNPFLYMLNTESSEKMDPALAKLTKNDLKAVECSPGETVLFPDGTKFTFNYGDGWDGRKLYLVYLKFAPNPLPVWVHKIDNNRWAADAEPYIKIASKAKH